MKPVTVQKHPITGELIVKGADKPRPKQMMVGNFYWKHVEPKYQQQFMKLMKQLDGSSGVYYSFYDIDLLEMKLKEAKEL